MLREAHDPCEGDAALPVPPGTGFGARKSGVRDAWILLGILILLGALIRASIGPLTAWVVERLPRSLDAEVGRRLGDLQRATSSTLADGRATHLGEIVRDIEPRVGRLVARNDAFAERVRVTVLDSDDVNAFALPGGEVFVFRGLLEAKAMNDDVLVGIVAHELAHAALRHGVRGLVRRNLLALVASALVGGLDAGTVSLVGGALSLGDLAYDRSMEEEADAIAGKLLVELGRPVEPLAQFLEELDALGPAVALFTNHPAGAARAASLRSLARGG